METPVPVLPYCAVCLQDFALHQPPCLLVCRHVYCSRCVRRLAHHSEVRCPYDDTVTPAESAEPDLGFFNRLEYVRKFVFPRASQAGELLSHFQQLIREVNLTQVPCKALLCQGNCPQDGQCGFSHTSESLSIARRFREDDTDLCWECHNCLLTLTRRLANCPVCAAPREERPENRVEGRERKGTNATLDLSPTVEEDTGARESLPEDCKMSAASVPAPQVPGKDADRRKRSACCILQ